MLVDELVRKRFEEALNQNFSVIAPAGVGKTTAIVKRIVNMVLSDAKEPTHYCTNLLVVTYTKKAALEMKERVRAALVQLKGYSIFAKYFNSIFFGTIHSLAGEIISQYGFYKGIPLTLELHPEGDSWQQFLAETPDLYAFLPKNQLAAVQIYVSIEKVLELAAKLPTGFTYTAVDVSPPVLDFQKLLEFEVNPGNEELIELHKNALRHWIAFRENQEIGIGTPAYSSSQSKKIEAFQSLWIQTFQPLKDWIQEYTLSFAARIFQAYSTYKYQKGWVCYEDMVFLANLIIEDPIIKPKVQARQYKILLDEAQDTDEAQFHFLLNLSNIAHASNGDVFSSEASEGYYCMVGDPQQAIYSSRTGLNAYANVHKNLVSQSRVESLEFCVTLRCDQKIVEWVNAVMPKTIQSNANKQSYFDFVSLYKKPKVALGDVSVLPLQKRLDENESEDVCEAKQIAFFLKTLGCAGLGIQNWQEVAILCPRKRWLIEIESQLRALDLSTQLHSHDSVLIDNPVYAWFLALVYIMAYPCDALEVCGVLREVFGISDHDIAHFVRDNKLQKNESETVLHPLNILFPVSSNCLVGRTLSDLHSVRNSIIQKPLRTAIGFLLEATQFKRRIQFLEKEAYSAGELERMLTHLILKSSQAELEGTDLRMFSDKLKNEMNTLQPETTSQSNHIQLYTCHKAKGLEWSVVIIPFLFREILFRNEIYPYVQQDLETGHSQVIWDRGQISPEFKALRLSHRRQELSRLAYVAFTRPKHKLILIDDQVLYSENKDSVVKKKSKSKKENQASDDESQKSKDNRTSNSLADVLGLTSYNQEYWNALERSF
jgi:ATP-dependent exoDNAse (exonuclease V) beta subunit